MSRVPTCPVQFTSMFPFLLRCFLITKHAQTCNFMSEERISSVSTFPPLYHMSIGRNNTVLCSSSWPRECSAAGERTKKKESESEYTRGLEFGPIEHILVCQMNQRQGVAPPAHVSSSASPRCEREQKEPKALKLIVFPGFIY